MSDPDEAQGDEEAHLSTDAAAPGPKSADHVIKPSTEKEPGEEAKAPLEQEEEEELSHEAVGIGVLDASGQPKQTDE